jgi:hypothetical protein
LIALIRYHFEPDFVPAQTAFQALPATSATVVTLVLVESLALTADAVVGPDRTFTPLHAGAIVADAAWTEAGAAASIPRSSATRTIATGWARDPMRVRPVSGTNVMVFTVLPSVAGREGPAQRPKGPSAEPYQKDYDKRAGVAIRRGRGHVPAASPRSRGTRGSRSSAGASRRGSR